MKKFITAHDRVTGIVYTEISGEAKTKDIKAWQTGIEDVLGSIENNTAFKMLINLQGFKPANLEVQKCFRMVLPQALAKHNWQLGYAELLGDPTPLSTERGVHCIAVAYVHYDLIRMKSYQELYGRPGEHYFSDMQKAYTWLKEL